MVLSQAGKVLLFATLSILSCVSKVSAQECRDRIGGCGGWKEHCDKSNILYFCPKTCTCEICQSGGSTAAILSLIACQLDCGSCTNGGGNGGGKPGNWGRYGSWTRCDVTCGGGSQQRTRRCRGAPNSCVGEATQTRPCNSGKCPDKACVDFGTTWCHDYETMCESDPYVKDNCQKTCGVCGKEPTGWGEWTQWSKCDVTCGSGSQEMTRTCQGGDCAGTAPQKKTRACSMQACGGGWTEWSDWGPCSLTCGSGEQESTRSCQGGVCRGPSKKTQTCVEVAVCPVWGNWFEWGACTVSCGNGSQVRSRSCVAGDCDPQGGKETRACNTDPCQTQEFSEWTEYGQCSLSCGGGTHRRSRTCLAGFGLCSGHDTEVKNCAEEECSSCSDILNNCILYKQSQQCGFSNVRYYCQKTCEACGELGGGGGDSQTWAEYGPCSVTCGVGWKSRYKGFLSQSITCIEKDCGTGEEETWSDWSAFGECSATCDEGTQTRTRTCPKPGACGDSATETRQCETNKCPTWQHWGGWSTCSTTCGPGKRTRQRECTVPGNCVGSGSGETDCFLANCEVAEWGDWFSWSACTKTCGTGQTERSRLCSIPEQCAGESKETNTCNVHACPRWSPWQDWSQCSKECGSGKQERKRGCSSPGLCQGNDKEERSCGTKKCPDWRDWGPWGACTRLCNVGTRSRERQCSVAEKCVGENSESEPCNTQSCPEWAEWSNWSECTLSCGGGKRTRARTCTIKGQCGKLKGRKKETSDCNTGACKAEWGEWSEWEDCSKPCGNGETKRTRTCRVSSCTGNAEEKMPCNTNACGDSSWSKCSKSCSGGTRRRWRCADGGCKWNFQSCGEGRCSEAQCSVISGTLRNRYNSKHDCCPTRHLPDGETCGQQRTGKRVIGGAPAKAKQWPWMVAVDMRGSGLCAGVVISHNFILSAAHCFATDEGRPLKTKGWKIYVGLLKLTEAGENPQLGIEIKKSYIHPEYSFPVADIALVELKHDVSYSDTIQPICLPWGEETPYDSTCFVTGWGVSNVPDTATNHLQELGILNFDPDVCVEAFGNHEELAEYVHFLSTNESYICAGSLSKKIDSCKGDSGGPLVCQRCDSCSWYVAGIVSFGANPCAARGVPGIYTKVVYYEDWITRTAGMNTYSLSCSKSRRN